MDYNAIMKNLENLLKALANDKRLAIIRTLKSKKELSVGEIADEIDLSFRSTSHHLKTLLNAGVLENQRRMNIIEYRIADSVPRVLTKIFPFIL